MLTALPIIIFVVLLVAGVPIAFVLALTGIAAHGNLLVMRTSRISFLKRCFMELMYLVIPAFPFSSVPDRS